MRNVSIEDNEGFLLKRSTSIVHWKTKFAGGTNETWHDLSFQEKKISNHTNRQEY